MPTNTIITTKHRCSWAVSDLAKNYHDTEWGVPTHDDRELFELLVLEGAQAGLSWETVLQKRVNYQKAFDNFDVKKVAAYSEAKQAELLKNSGIIRNRLKIKSAIQNAKAFIRIQSEYGSFSHYLWSFVHGKPVIGDRQSIGDIPASTTLSNTISKDLKQRGFSFVGTTIVYAFLQSTGVVNDHVNNCYKKKL